MDRHLNIFYPYSIKETDNIREDNITRASLIAFSELTNDEKIDYINTLVGKTVLSKDNYDYEISLQPTVKISTNCNKFLIGFCPSGKVRNCDTIDEASNAIFASTSNHSARADGQISIYNRGKLHTVLIFENKFQDLFEDQLKRHYEMLLDTTDIKNIKNTLILKSYNQFFSLYKNYKNRLCSDLIEFVNIAGYLKPSEFSDIEKNKYNRKSNIEFLLGKALDEVCVDGKRDIQVGWGEIIDIKDLNEIINMIGLVYHSDDTIQLSLLFGSLMTSARKLYELIDFKKIKLTKEFAGEFHVGFWKGYIENSFIKADNTQKYLEFVSSNLKDLKQCDLSGLKTYVNKLVKATDTKFDENKYCFEDKRLTHKRINIIPSLGYSFYWNVKDLYNVSFKDFVKEIKCKINECISILGITIKF